VGPAAEVEGVYKGVQITLSAPNVGAKRVSGGNKQKMANPETRSDPLFCIQTVLGLMGGYQGRR
jgi:hypothetical protein